VTATLDAVGNLHDAAGRFASKACPRVYALLDTLAETGTVTVRAEGGWAVHAARCPHGHFARWAARNCKPCIRLEARRA